MYQFLPLSKNLHPPPPPPNLVASNSDSFLLTVGWPVVCLLVLPGLALGAVFIGQDGGWRWDSQDGRASLSSRLSSWAFSGHDSLRAAFHEGAVRWKL